MGVEITGKLTDGVTASHTHGPSNDTLATTAPKDNGGTGEHFTNGPSPPAMLHVRPRLWRYGLGLEVNLTASSTCRKNHEC